MVLYNRVPPINYSKDQIPTRGFFSSRNPSNKQVIKTNCQKIKAEQSVIIRTIIFQNFFAKTDHLIYAQTAKDNQASTRVLEKCGFCVNKEKKGFANARGKEIEELILVLNEF